MFRIRTLAVVITLLAGTTGAFADKAYKGYKGVVKPALFTGLYLGADLGVSNWTYRYDDLLSVAESNDDDTSNAVFQDFDGDVSQPVWFGSLLIGYQHIFNQLYTLAIEFAANTGGQNADVNDQITYVGDESTLETSVNVDYSFDLVVKPGIFLTDTVLAYFKFGGSYAHLKNDFDMIHNTIATFDSNDFALYAENDDVNLWGYVAGVGIEKAVIKNLTVYTEYDFRYYDKTDLHDVTFQDNVTSSITGITTDSIASYDREVRPWANSFKLGLRWYFG